jgi:hypothetical protein
MRVLLFSNSDKTAEVFPLAGVHYPPGAQVKATFMVINGDETGNKLGKMADPITARSNRPDLAVICFASGCAFVVLRGVEDWLAVASKMKPKPNKVLQNAALLNGIAYNQEIGRAYLDCKIDFSCAFGPAC